MRYIHLRFTYLLTYVIYFRRVGLFWCGCSEAGRVEGRMVFSGRGNEPSPHQLEVCGRYKLSSGVLGESRETPVEIHLGAFSTL